jgi:SHS2 domain-containing protein
MEKYKFISELVFEAYDEDLKELVENASFALSSFICKIEDVKLKDKEEFLVKGDDLDSTIFNWLGAIITIINTEKKFFSKFEVKEVDEGHIKVRIFGEDIKPSLVKNPSPLLNYSKYKLEKTNNGYKVTVALKLENEEI